MRCLGEHMTPENVRNIVFNLLLYGSGDPQSKPMSANYVGKLLGMGSSSVELLKVVKQLNRMKLIRRNMKGWYVYARSQVLAGEQPPIFREGAWEHFKKQKRKRREAYLKRLALENNMRKQ